MLGDRKANDLGRATQQVEARSANVDSPGSSRAGIAQAQALLQQGTQVTAPYVDLIRRFPQERTQIFELLQRAWGNSFVQKVMSAMSQAPNGEVSATGALDSAAATPVAFAAHVGGGKGSTQPSLGGSRAGDVLAFNSPEHQTYGDEASRAEGRTQPYTKPTPEEQTGKPDPEHFALTHGDINMLTGDYFEPREVDKDGKPILDNLFALMNKPSSSPGQMVGTRDELIFAIKDANPKDPRFQPSGVWEKIQFSDPVKTAVTDRYLQRASRNYEHFAQPAGPKSGGAQSGDEKSAGGSYRALHETAIKMAAAAKAKGDTIDDALAHEAASEHYLEDSYAAGHLRTPRLSMETYWRGKYPLFFENFKKTVAKDVAIYMSAHESSSVAQLGGEIEGSVVLQIDAATAHLPEIGIDTIVAELTHDEDNADGVWVTNDLGEKWLTFGDSHGGIGKAPPTAQAATKAHVEAAVRLSIEDVQHAYEQGPSANDVATFAAVRARTSAPAKPGTSKYGAEQAVPHPDPAASKQNGTQGWQQADFEALWKARIRSDKPETFGSEIAKSAKSGDIHSQLAGLSGMFPEMQKLPVIDSVLHPRAAYEGGFLGAMTNDAHAKLHQIIDYDPGRGRNLTGSATVDDLDRLQQEGEAGQRAGVKGAGKDSQMRGLTVKQREEYVSNLESIRGKLTSDTEKKRILDIFRTATPHDRRALYQRLEGHAWQGDFENGDWFGDALTRNLDPDQLKELKKLLGQK